MYNVVLFEVALLRAAVHGHNVSDLAMLVKEFHEPIGRANKKTDLAVPHKIICQKDWVVGHFKGKNVKEA